MPLVTRKALVFTALALAGLTAAAAAYVYLVVLGGEKGYDINRYGSVLAYDPPLPLATFKLNSTEGPIEFPIKGKLNVVTPQYLGCPDICPLESLMMVYTMAKLAEDGLQDKVVFVTVDVDPWRDTPEAARNYMEGYAGELMQKGVKWIWLVDDVDVMKEVWDNLTIFVQKDFESGLVTHTGGFYIISPDGRLLYFLSPSSLGWQEPDKFAVLLYDTVIKALEETGLK